jgi:hypothetical protein
LVVDEQEVNDQPDEEAQREEPHRARPRPDDLADEERERLVGVRPVGEADGLPGDGRTMMTQPIVCRLWSFMAACPF